MWKLTAMAVALGFLAVLAEPVPVQAQQQEKCYKFCQKRCTAANRKSDCEGACMSKCMSQQKKN